MPEMPEVQGLVDFLRRKLIPEDGPPAVVAGLEVASFSVLKTAKVPVQSLAGLQVQSVDRRGKFLVLEIGGLFLVMHLARAGWLRWSDSLSTARLKPGKGLIALRVRFADAGTEPGPGGEPGFDLTEAGTRKSLAAYVVESPEEVPGIARLGPDALELDLAGFKPLLHAHAGQIKGLLRDQSKIAGIGNAYSDEILHAARLSPFALANKLDDDAVATLHTTMRHLLRTAIEAASGRPAKELKDTKRQSLRVHARTGEACPVCGDTVREVSFADSSLQYCPTCQTGGKPLADRRTSKFLK
ncbi:DNA-formamidopyrimidine glycosylase family protein [Arthrobacter sp. TB 23]|uniref:DNA-formamidopyrimidine glycosylase family protein n=1 Tax=Arthrobacter sp. TB 23 TaxID=494419 RepID=UPI000474D9CD|nr:DNA-formamidopyrimidine glycosylase family protein [Arthrobacter sp. TB 23]